MDGSALRIVTRRRFLGGGVALAAAALGRPPAAFGQSTEFKGVTLNVACFQHAFTNVLKDLLPDFESRSGMKVNFQTPAFPVYNQRTDLELSTGGSAWDVVNITFIYSGKWIGSGWMTPLEEFIRDRNATPPDWHPEDFVPGAQASVVDAKGVRYGFSWEAGAMILAASRGDLLAKANVKLPETLDDLMRVAAAVDGKDGVKAFGNDNLHHWHWPPYLMAFGGKVFADAPRNLTPTLDSREAVESADYYAKLLRDYSPAGALSFTMDQMAKSHRSGKVNIRTQSIPWLAPLASAEDSTVKSTVRFGFVPRGPAGAFPQVATHSFGIPAGSKQKRAGWEFIKWALSKDTVRRSAIEKGYIAVTRKSVIDDPLFRKAMTLNGQDVAALYLRTLEEAGRGYMRYRTVHVFPPVGDKINKAIERIVTKQQSAKDAMAQAQREAVMEIKKAGVNIDA